MALAPQADLLSANEAAERFVRELAGHRFWGSITIRFEAGKVVHVIREESFKPSELPIPGKPGSYHATTP
jgi:hypothetical protein